jgi:hypothetical protein
MLKKYCDECKQPITEDRPDIFEQLSSFGTSIKINFDYFIDISVFDRAKTRKDHSICPACFIDAFMLFYQKELSMNPPSVIIKQKERELTNGKQ